MAEKMELDSCERLLKMRKTQHEATNYNGTTQYYNDAMSGTTEDSSASSTNCIERDADLSEPESDDKYLSKIVNIVKLSPAHN
jgi:hypothetical protein